MVKCIICSKKSVLKSTCSCGEIVIYCESCSYRYGCDHCFEISCNECFSFCKCPKCNDVSKSFCYSCGPLKSRSGSDYLICKNCGFKIVK